MSSPSSTSPENGRIHAIADNESFDNTWPFKAHYTSAPGFQMHYVDEGEGAENILLLHGEPTWSYLFRQQIPVWAHHSRVIAVDHMGFGKSETPADRSYWLQDHVDNLETFVLALGLADITLVMHDFGGPVGMGLATRHPERIKRIISVNGPTPLGQANLEEALMANAAISPWFQWIQHAEDENILEEVLRHLDDNILSTMKLNGFTRNEIVTDTWINAYAAPFPSPSQCSGAIGWAKGFATGAHRFEAPDGKTKKRIRQLPAQAIWGEQDRTLNSQHFLPLFTELFPDGIVHKLADAGHYSPEDAPAVIAELVTNFILSS